MPFTAFWDAATYIGKNAALLRNLASVYPEVGNGHTIVRTHHGFG